MVRRIAALLLVFGLSGCGLIGRSPDTGPGGGPPPPPPPPPAAEPAAKSPLPELAAAVARSGEVPLTAEYKAARSDGVVEPGSIVLIHHAPVVVLIRQTPAATTSEIWTPTDTYLCAVGGQAGKGRCEHRGPSESAKADPESWAAAFQDDELASGRLLDPFVALHELEGTIRDHQPEVTRSTRTYAGQRADCVKTVVQGQSVQAENEACFTVHGIVAFADFGLAGEGKAYSYHYELIRYSESVDPARLKPPAGATIVEA
jgi:hypothetical protein